MKLTKSQRVKVIGEVASRLERDDWTSIDLVLTQFGFQTSDQWPGDKKTYVVDIIGSAKDQDLIELAQHFGMRFEGLDAVLAATPETPYWHDGQLRVFISHLASEREQAANLRSNFAHYWMSGFVAHNDINPTREWQIEIENALATCDMLVALFCPDFVSSKWCDQEIGYALGRGIPVFAVRCGADPHGFVSRFQAFNGNGKSPIQIAKELFEASIDHKKLQDKMADVVIDLFVNSGSYAEAKRRIAYVERLKTWDSSYSTRLSKALKTNGQISGSWGVSDQINALIKKWK